MKDETLARLAIEARALPEPGTKGPWFQSSSTTRPGPDNVVRRPDGGTIAIAFIRHPDETGRLVAIADAACIAAAPRARELAITLASEVERLELEAQASGDEIDATRSDNRRLDSEVERLRTEVARLQAGNTRLQAELDSICEGCGRSDWNELVIPRECRRCGHVDQDDPRRTDRQRTDTGNPDQGGKAS